MVRFFVDPDEMSGNIVILTAENAAHARVLRLKQGEKILVSDGQGNECQCTISDVSNGQVSAVVDSRGRSDAEAGIFASVYMAFSKGDKFEHVVQKATELGAARIIAFPSGRCVSRPDEKSLKKKLERWQKIASAAAEQSGRGVIPEIAVMPSFEEALNDAAKADLGILFYENESSVTLHMVLQENSYQSISILTGPEGGLEVPEVEQAIAVGLKVCTLGKRILRCETAPLCALSAIMYASGEF